MPTYSLKLLDDPVARYRLDADGVRIGEIRHHAMHAEILYVGDRGYWLVEDALERAADAGASMIERFVRRLNPNRSYSLKDEQQTLACAQRRWNPLRRIEWIDYREGTAAVIRATPRSALSGEVELKRDDVAIGRLAVVGLLQHRVELDCDSFSPTQAAFLMYVTHRCWGNNPYVGVTSP